MLAADGRTGSKGSKFKIPEGIIAVPESQGKIYLSSYQYSFACRSVFEMPEQVGAQAVSNLLAQVSVLKVRTCFHQFNRGCAALADGWSILLAAPSPIMLDVLCAGTKCCPAAQLAACRRESIGRRASAAHGEAASRIRCRQHS